MGPGVGSVITYPAEEQNHDSLIPLSERRRPIEVDLP